MSYAGMEDESHEKHLPRKGPTETLPDLFQSDQHPDPTTSATDLSDLEAEFSARISCASACLALVEDGDPAATAATINSAKLELTALKRSIRETRETLLKWREQSIKAAYLSRFLTNIPQIFNSITEEMSSHPRLLNGSTNGLQAVATKKESLTKHESKETGNKNPPNPSSSNVRVKSFPVSAKVLYLTMSEFDAIPKYMKGRLQYESVNGAIDEYNKGLETKYNFLLKGFQAMASIKEKELFKKMKALETRDTKGVYFLVGEDLRNSPTLKSETTRRTIFTILRHCQRVREIRGPGSTLRYASVQQSMMV